VAARSYVPAPASPNSVDLMAVSARLEVSPRATPAQELRNDAPPNLAAGGRPGFHDRY
jgi:hypothetical protein